MTMSAERRRLSAMKSGVRKSRGLILAALVIVVMAAGVAWWQAPAELTATLSTPSVAPSSESLVVPAVQAAPNAPILPEPAPAEAAADEGLDQIAEKFAAEPALIDALEDEQSSDERTRTEAREVVEASTREP